MKTRKIQTKIWLDNWFLKLSSTSKLIFLYLISNPHIGLSGYLELPDDIICFECKVTKSQLETAKKDLKNKVTFYKGWLFVSNLLKHDPIVGDKNTLWKPFNKEVEAVPEEIKRKLDNPSMGDRWGIDGGKGIGIGKGIGNNELITSKEKEKKYNTIDDLKDSDFLEMSVDYNVPMAFVMSKFEDLKNYCEANGKKYKNYKSALRNFVKKDAIERVENAKKQNGFGKTRRELNVDEELKRRNNAR